jgi:hypothetical protein
MGNLLPIDHRRPIGLPRFARDGEEDEKKREELPIQYPHVGPVILKLLAAIEAHYIVLGSGCG